jgi:hypothetical protein
MEKRLHRRLLNLMYGPADQPIMSRGRSCHGGDKGKASEKPLWLAAYPLRAAPKKPNIRKQLQLSHPIQGQPLQSGGCPYTSIHDSACPVHPPDAAKVIAFPQVGGLHHRYERLAA